MSETIKVSNVSISQIESGESFQSQENPLVYSSPVVNGQVTVGVVAPFHNNVDASVLPSISVSVGDDGNDVLITPSYNPQMPLSTTYTQVAKISFTLNDVALNMGEAVINVTVDEEGLPDNNSDRLGDPKKKTKVTASNGG
ncbi:hypothetical protein BTO05_11320 [Winogradskyella sp. PC-19]|uniref:hypothetical protein n=1 Tax=unclassified Winogradskyella TaxID=2615021 RepID=UPI000B3C7694|nr:MULTISPECIES: hypothetical protein [unclassified Winogradskyella]ARV10197.1 hypothetical protein BTO05_11320 [Winogradskyella sp. PC-19]RZN82099.1 MAG: hypothetical protein EVB12_03350 [Winogradskyella sp.]